MPRNATTFAAGNLAALKHGSRSARVQATKQQKIGARIRRELRSNDKRYLERLIVDVECRLDSYRSWLLQRGGPISDRGLLAKCLEKQDRDETKLLRLRGIWEGRPDAPDDLILALQRLREARA